MLDIPNYYDVFVDGPMYAPPIIKPNIRTGEGRAKPRPWSAHKAGDQKKKVHRKMAKKSRRANRR